MFVNERTDEQETATTWNFLHSISLITEASAYINKRTQTSAHSNSNKINIKYYLEHAWKLKFQSFQWFLINSLFRSFFFFLLCKTSTVNKNGTCTNCVPYQQSQTKKWIWLQESRKALQNERNGKKRKKWMRINMEARKGKDNSKKNCADFVAYHMFNSTRARECEVLYWCNACTALYTHIKCIYSICTNCIITTDELVSRLLVFFYTANRDNKPIDVLNRSEAQKRGKTYAG